MANPPQKARDPKPPTIVSTEENGSADDLVSYGEEDAEAPTLDGAPREAWRAEDSESEEDRATRADVAADHQKRVAHGERHGKI